MAARLPVPDDLERIWRAMAALDAILGVNPRTRTFSYDPSWSSDVRLGTMDDGSGNTAAVLFSPSWTVARGFDHESDLSPWARDDGSIAEGLLDGFPEHLLHVIDHPDFRLEGGPRTDLTFCAWWVSGASSWSTGEPLGPEYSVLAAELSAAYLFDVPLGGGPEAYVTYADEYWQVNVDPGVVSRFYETVPADAETVRPMAPDQDVARVVAELQAQGYPTDPALG